MYIQTSLSMYFAYNITNTHICIYVDIIQNTIQDETAQFKTVQ